MSNSENKVDSIALLLDKLNQEVEAPANEPEVKVEKKKKFKQPKLDKKLLELVAEKKAQKAQEKAQRMAQGEVDRDFNNYFLPVKLLANLQQHGYNRATDIQAKAIPVIAEGHDVLISAETGTGKTLSYLIPAIERLFTLPPGVQQHCHVLIVAPTRDLVSQIHALAQELLANTYYKVASFIGDINNTSGKQDREQAFTIFSQHQLVITTPGRLVKQLETNGDIDLTGVSLLILDEADRLLEMGAGEDINKIVQHLPKRENTVLVSATLEQRVVDLFSSIALNNPVTIRGSHSRAEKNTLTQYYYHADNIEHKKELLVNLLKDLALTRTIVFVRKVDTVQPLAKYIMNQRMGLRATGISGEMTKEERERALGLFKAGKINVLVTTDLLARGIDIEDVKAVFNYDLPYDGATFMHRVGRTGRFGKKGLAISLVQAHDYKLLGKAMRFMKVVIPAKVFPGLEPTTSVSPDALKGERKVKQKDNQKKKKEQKPKVKVRARDKKNKGYPKKFAAYKE
ncbi:hypothetical protein CJP74_05255 [Psittacicella melopsittaci]|uniref:ATP-dependent RNA helicase SrmB n=1 Tax=Psittacicella melopsittaci TaxID=2028576 RepID=A0A3A1Y7V2_9GAMM|nr:DEAD/DEAH box helicase [Psittacicella melopsittaci]RIY32174.1 hypothetical protein CJP74_05255 [Psittacicella melopsittaci]